MIQDNVAHLNDEKTDTDITESQKGIWFACAANNDSSLYVTAQIIELKEVDVERLCNAITLASSSTESLQLVFDKQRPVASKFITPSASPISIFYEGDNVLGNYDNFLSHVKSRVYNDINIYKGKLHANYIFVNSRGECSWVLAVHHIAFDDYSYALYIKKVVRLYESREDSSFAQEVGLKNVAEEEARYRNSENFARAQDFWDGFQEEDYEPAVLFPDYAHKLSNVVAAREGAFSNELTAKILSFSDFPELVLAAIGSYFYKINRAPRIAFGFGMMGRHGSISATQPVTMVNNIPFYLSIQGDQKVKEIHNNTKKMLGAIRKYQKYRGEWIAKNNKAIHGAQARNRVDVHIVVEDEALLKYQIIKSVSQLITGPVIDSRIFFRVSLQKKTIVIRLETSKPDQEIALAMHLSRIEAWISKFIKHFESRVKDIPVISIEECRLIEEWNNTDFEFPQTDVASLFETQVSKTPSNIALVFEGVRITYKELNERAERLSNFILKLIDPSDRVVGVAMTRSIELEIVLVAIFKAGLAYMPISEDLPADRIRSMCFDAGVSIVIAQSDQKFEIPNDIHVLHVDNNVGNRMPIVPNKAVGSTSHRSPDNVAYVIFTSGTTGRPKGVQVSQRSLVNRLLWMQHAYPLLESDSVLQKTPYGFDVSVWEFFWPVIVGASLVMAPPLSHKDPNILCDLIKKSNITVLHFVPSMLDLFIRQFKSEHGYEQDCLSKGNSRLPSLRMIFCSGEALSLELVRRACASLSANLVNLYGPTEAAIDVTHWAVSSSRLEDLFDIPLGSPIWNTKIHVLDEFYNQLPIGFPGELCIEGAGLAFGYSNNSRLTEEKFVEYNGVRVYRTGDIAKWDHSGNIHYIGRVDNQIKLNGVRIELSEIETTIIDSGLVSQVRVVVINRSIVVFVREDDILSNESGAILKKRIQDICRNRLPVYMCPSDVVFIDEFPTTNNGKMDFNQIAEIFNRSRAVGAPVDSTTLPLEREICEVFERVLGIPTVLPSQSFFELGGSSYLAIQLALEIRDRFGWEVSIADVFLFQTPRMLLEHTRKLSNDGPADIGGLSVKVVLRPSLDASCSSALFCIHPAGGISWCYSKLASFLRSPCEIIGIQARGLTSPEAINENIKELASSYVDEIQAHQPSGPYRLVGWSVGGMIAHEVACLLQERGNRVELLALMDSYPSDLWRFLQKMPLSNQQEESLALAALLYIAGVPLPRGDVKGGSIFVSPVQLISIDEARNLLKEYKSPLSFLGIDVLENLVKVVANSRRVVSGSNHSIFQGDVLFFRAAKPRPEIWLNPSSWKKYITGDVCNVDIDSDHPGMISSRSMKEIAGRIDDYLLK